MYIPHLRLYILWLDFDKVVMDASGENQLLNFLLLLNFDWDIFFFLSKSMCILTVLRFSFFFLGLTGDRLRTDAGKLLSSDRIGGSPGFFRTALAWVFDVADFIISRAWI